MRTRMTSLALALLWTGFVATITSGNAVAGAQEDRSVVAPGAEVRQLATGFRFVEGPVADKEGNVYFCDVPGGRIHKWSLDGKVTIHRENSGAACGLCFDPTGHLVACELGGRQVTADDLKGNVTVLVKEFDGKKLNSPNDLWIDPKGGIYFSDPIYGGRGGREQDGEHVYYLTPDRKKTIRVCGDLTKPNGLIGTPDGKTLYVADAGDRKTWRYTIQPDGTLTDKKLFCESGSDGVTMDERGNVYLTAGAVLVFDPSGKQIESVQVPGSPSNVTFAGKDGRLLFITARGSIYAVDMAVHGATPKTWKSSP